MNWKPLTRIAFRFSFAYLGLYILATQIAGSLFYFPYLPFRGLGPLWPMRDVTVWIAVHVFHINTPLVFTGDSIGETAFFWVQAFWILVAAIAATFIWSALDKRRRNYAALHSWFRLFIRLALAAQMFEYGMTKVIPNQFRAPPLITLTQPVGHQTLEGILWASIGASLAYQIFLGCAEMLGGILLLFPRTTLLGALICLADLTQVFVLNMTYDIGLKQISFHLILLSVFLIAPDFRRLCNFFFLNREAIPSSAPSANRIALALGIYLIGAQAFVNVKYWQTSGGGSSRSALYGIWNVNELSVDGQTRPAILNDYDRQWRRIIFDAPGTIAFQRTDDSIAHYGVSIDSYRNSLALTKGGSRNWNSSFAFERPADDQLILDGEMDSHHIRMRLRRVELDSFPLRSSSFRWVRPNP